MAPSGRLIARPERPWASSTSSSGVSASTQIDLRTVFTGAELQVSAGFTSDFDDLSQEESVPATQNLAAPTDESLFDDDSWSDEFESALDDIADDVSDGWQSEESADDVFGELAAAPVGPLNEEEL